MRKDVKKMLFLGLTSQKDSFFRQAQEAGLIHFIQPGSVSSLEKNPILAQFVHALKILRHLPVQAQEQVKEGLAPEELVQEILQLQEKIDALREKEDSLKREITRVAPFGEFSKEDIAFIEKFTQRHVQFFLAKHKVIPFDQLQEDLLYLYSDEVFDYFVGISKAKIKQPGLIELSIDEPLQDLKKRLEQIVTEKEALTAYLKSYQKYSSYLHHALIEQLNENALVTTQEYVQLAMDDQLFAVEGWVPAYKLAEISKLTSLCRVYTEEILVEADEIVPTYLENQGWSKVGEDLVHIYDTPSSTDRDPSLWVLIFFGLFFAMIIGDGGYGLVFAVAAIFFRYRFKTMTQLGYRVWKLLGLLAACCIAWGVLTNSFFGIPVSLDSPVMQTSLINGLVKKKTTYHWAKQDSTYQSWTKKYPQAAQLTNPEDIFRATGELNEKGILSSPLYNKFSDNIMMELALFIGCVHIVISLLRYLNRRRSQLGWILFIVGCYLYLPSYLGATTMLQYLGGVDVEQVASLGLYLIVGGFLLAVSLSVAANKAKGLLEAMNIIQVFSDVLSYLRLYALGMAGAMMSSTINDGAAALGGGVLGALLILLGHLFNIVLSIMSGVIHGLRLNFLEWYHYSFSGEGKPFRPLKKIKIE